jgi:tetratricopeptide (TPR) repeat protein
MTPTLSLIEHLLGEGRKFQRLGRPQEALHALGRLVALRELPCEVAEEAQARLADLCLGRRRFRRARRHLTAALLHNPDHAPHHLALARACHADGRGDLKRALAHYRRALELTPDHAAALVEAGRLAIQLGHADDGLAWLRRALAAAPDDAEVVGQAARGLGQAGRHEEARAALRAALFRNPRSPRFRKLWLDYQFRQVRRRQELDRLQRDRLRQDEGPVLLPFVPAPRPADATRSDGPATLPGPHRPRLAELPDRRSVR